MADARRLVALLAALVVLLTACGSDPVQPSVTPRLTGEALVDALRDGGLVLYLRHTDTTEGGVDSIDTVGDCSLQRELSEDGRQDAREIGAAFEALEIPLERVVASPFCRTTETATLAFGEVESDEGLLALASTGNSEENDRLEQRGRELVATPPADGQNVVLVGHVSNVGPITGVSPEEGGTALFRPDGEGGFALVAEVPPQGWQRLAETYGATGS